MERSLDKSLIELEDSRDRPTKPPSLSGKSMRFESLKARGKKRASLAFAALVFTLVIFLGIVAADIVLILRLFTIPVIGLWFIAFTIIPLVFLVVASAAFHGYRRHVIAFDFQPESQTINIYHASVVCGTGFEILSPGDFKSVVFLNPRNGEQPVKMTTASDRIIFGYVDEMEGSALRDAFIALGVQITRSALVYQTPKDDQYALLQNED